MVSRRLVARSIAERLIAGEDAKRLLRSLAAYIVVNRIEGQVGMLLQDINQELASKGRVVANITTARELSDDLRQILTDYVRQVTQASQVSLEETIDSSLIGGMIIETPGLALDASVSGKLKQLRTT